MKIAVSFRSLVFPRLTSDLDLTKVHYVRVPATATKGELDGYLETVLFGRGPREGLELFKHGRRGQWGWDLWVKSPGGQGWGRLREGEMVGTFTGEGGEGMVELRGVICFDPEYEDF